MTAKVRAAVVLENRAIANAWYGEALARTKKVNGLSSYLLSPDGKPKQAIEQTPEDMLATLQALKEGGADMRFEFIPDDPSEGE